MWYAPVPLPARAAFVRFKELVQAGTREKAIALAHDALNTYPNDPAILNAFSWELLTNKDGVTDVALALQLAEASVKGFENQDPASLDTYALALYMSGDRQGAIENQRRAVELTKDSSLRDRLEAQLNKYLAK